jgi:DNA invertase Pin-like site-specific DNA recombinase
MNKSQFRTKAKQLLETGETWGEFYKRIAKKTGYSVKTVERAAGNGKIDASKRFYEIFNSKFK